MLLLHMQIRRYFNKICDNFQYHGQCVDIENIALWDQRENVWITDNNNNNHNKK